MRWASEAVAVETVTLERLTFHAQRWITEEAIEATVEPRVMMDREARALVADLAMTTMANRVWEEEHPGSFEVPADWWQHFRQRWSPAWWLARWPVVQRKLHYVKTWNHYRVCPHVAARIPERPVAWLVTG